jgi:ABC-type sugar transport system substrate-binding protein
VSASVQRSSTSTPRLRTARPVAALALALVLALGLAGRTAAAPPSGAPGGPILVITDPSNPFTGYYAEILRAEGLNEFALADIGSVTTAMLTASAWDSATA